ncbi:MAG: hypothetical protein J6D29_07185 [Solobacterium sp.]|nr:hypothetical protein [Solobacterium sp.]
MKDEKKKMDENRNAELATQFYAKIKKEKISRSYKDVLKITHMMRKAAAEDAHIN